MVEMDCSSETTAYRMVGKAVKAGTIDEVRQGTALGYKLKKE
jgi:hypothetical protein